jgi:hypothetical protein
MPNYEVNYNKFIYWLNHPELKRSNLFDFLRCLVSPIIFIKNAFDSFRKETDYKIKITSQVVYLERALNDKFDYSERRIYIKNIVKQMPLKLFDRDAWDQISDDEKVYLNDRSDNDPVKLYDRETNGLGGIAVNVPFTLSAQQRIKMNSLMEYYKYPGKRHIIIENA